MPPAILSYPCTLPKGRELVFLLTSGVLGWVLCVLGLKGTSQSPA